MLESMLTELRRAVRSLLRVPGYATVAVLTLALGIGATTAIYTLVERVALDPLPYPESGRLVRLKNEVPGVGGGREWQLSTAQYFYYGGESRTLESLGTWRRTGANVQTPSGPQRASLAVVTSSMLRLMGATPALGRLIDAEDDAPGATLVVVLSYGFWQREYGGRADALGQVLEINGQPAEVVGVLGRGQELPQEPGAPVVLRSELWLPMRLNPEGPFQNNHVYPTIARLAPGATVEEAQAELDRLRPRLPEVFPQVYSQGFFDRYGFRTRVYDLKSYTVGSLARNLWILLGAVGLVLLIACANVANLVLVRVEGRRRELAVRSALGAGPGALVRHLLAESLVLAAVGGAVALVVGIWGVQALAGLAPVPLPGAGELGLDGSVLAFTLAVALAVAVALTLLPLLGRGAMLRGAGAMVAAGNRSLTTGRERQRTRGVLVVTQVALALVLIVGAALLVESLRGLRATDPGVDPEGVVTMDIFLTPSRYDSWDAMWRFYSQLLEKVRALPGVTAAGLSEEIPFNGSFGCTVQGFEDRRVYERLSAADLTTCAGQEPTTPGYFEAMGIPIVQGRAFEAADNDQPERGAVIVSRAFARRFWPGEDALGKGVAPSGRTEGPFYHVVGVADDVYASSVDEDPAIAVYYPVRTIPESGGWWPSAMSLAVKTDLADPLAVVPAVRGAVQEVDPGIPLANADAMTTTVDRSMGRVSFTMTLLGTAAAMALLLAAIGLYGVLAYLVSRRTKEIGVRMALGAEPGRVRWLVVAGSLKLAALGVALGVVGALAASRVLEAFLYGVTPSDPSAYLAAILVLGGVAFLASWLPARRASRLQPTDALRVE